MTDFGQNVPERIGEWRVISAIGRGELAQVYAATNDANDSGALKLFAPHLLNAQQGWSTYQATAAGVAALGSDVIVPARHFGIDAKLNRPFSVSERVQEPSLERIVASSGLLSPERVVRVLETIAAAMDAAHAAGIVHRDLKPTNLFVSADEPLRVRITDFGVSAVRIAAPPPPGWGATAGWHGPDAAEPSSPATPAMDVYALGLVAFYALTGRSPFRALEHRALDTSQLWSELIEPLGSAAFRARELGIELPSELDSWFARTLAPHPRSRFRSIGEMTKALSDAIRMLDDPRRVPGPARPRAGPSVAPRSGAERPSGMANGPHEPSHDVHDHPAHVPPGVAAAVVQPIAFMPSLPPPRRAEKAPPSPPAAEEPSLPAATSNVLVPILLGAILLAIAGLGTLLLLRQPPPPTAQVAPATSAPATSTPAVSEAAPSAPVSALPAESQPRVAEITAPSASAGEAPSASANAEPGLESVPPMGSALVRFECAPARCDAVFCDGKAVANIFEPIPLRAGRHICKALKQGYRSVSQTFSVRSGQNTARVFPQQKRPKKKSKYKPITGL